MLVVNTERDSGRERTAMQTLRARAAMGCAGAALSLEYVRTCDAALTAPVTRAVAVENNLEALRGLGRRVPYGAFEMTGGVR